LLKNSTALKLLLEFLEDGTIPIFIGTILIVLKLTPAICNIFDAHGDLSIILNSHGFGLGIAWAAVGLLILILGILLKLNWISQLQD
jgi:hypothetical protein